MTQFARTLTAESYEIGSSSDPAASLKRLTMEIAFARVMKQFEIECGVLNLDPQDFEPEAWTCAYSEYARVEVDQIKMTCALTVSFARKHKTLKIPTLPSDSFPIF